MRVGSVPQEVSEVELGVPNSGEAHSVGSEEVGRNGVCPTLDDKGRSICVSSSSLAKSHSSEPAEVDDASTGVVFASGSVRMSNIGDGGAKGGQRKRRSWHIASRSIEKSLVGSENSNLGL